MSYVSPSFEEITISIAEAGKFNMKNIIILISIFSVVLISPICSAIETKEERILNDFLYSKEIKKEEEAYWYILRNKEKFSYKIFQELIKYQNRTDVPDKLIYLAAILREERFIKPLVSLIQNREYSDRQCIYDCPIVFSLTIFACFSEYSLPKDLFNKRLTAVLDLNSDIKRVKSISLKKEKASKNIKGPDVDALFQAYESFSTEQLIEIAGPYNEDYNSRSVAADILSHSIYNCEHLLPLYWLAIKEAYDASDQYRGSIYKAIYRAETARGKKQKKGNK